MGVVRAAARLGGKALRGREAQLSPLDADADADADAVRRSRERIASLHALARQAAESAAAATGRRVDQARDARRALAHLRDQAAGGGACDVEC